MFQREELVRSLGEIGIRPRIDVFADLAAAYDDDDRHYHTRKHIAQCLKHFGRFRHLASRPAEIEIAIWFHDAIYDTHRNDNEDASANWAEKYLTDENAHPDVIARIRDMIIATKSHEPDSTDAALLVDVDLGILGAPPETFEAYDRAIRKEYAWVPEDQYRAGRTQILRSFLERDVVFHTKEIQAELEAGARQNLRRKIDDLGT